MRKLLKKISVIVLALTLSLSCFVGCNPVREADQTLEVFIANRGYGIDGVKAALYSFAEQDWVKEKYPNIKIAEPVDERSPNYGINKIKAPSQNNFDLIFVIEDLAPFFGKNSRGESTLVELSDVYNGEVPGEPGVIFKDKMNDQSLQYVTYINGEGEEEYYDFPWCTGYLGFVYNPELVANYVDDVPRTTDELIEFMAKVKAGPENKASMTPDEIAAWNIDHCGNAGGFAYAPCGGTAYETYMFEPWWAQYDGAETFNDFWDGIYTDASGIKSYSEKIFDAQGRLKSMEVMAELLSQENGYYDLALAEKDFMVAQTTFLKGEYPMTICADWFDSEMKLTRETMIAEYEAGVEGAMMPKDLRVLITPVVSDIVEKLSYRNGGSLMTDEQLSFLVECIDEKLAYADANTAFVAEFPGTPELTRKDYSRLMDARAVYRTGAMGHTACIPSVSNSIDVAKDFVRYLATDVCQLAYMEATEGQNIPFEFDPNSTATLYGTNTTVADAYIAVHAKCSPMQQPRLDYFFNTFNPVQILVSNLRKPLSQVGMKSLELAGNIGWVLRAQNPPSPQSIFNTTRNAYDGQRFRFLCFEAGLVEDY